MCTAPSDLTGYTVTNTELNVATGFSVTAACAAGYTGLPTVTPCTTSGTPYTVVGCTQSTPPPPSPPPPVTDLCAGVSCGGHGICSGGSCTCTGGYTGNLCQNAPTPTCQELHTIWQGECDDECWNATSEGEYYACVQQMCGSEPDCFANIGESCGKQNNDNNNLKNLLNMNNTHKNLLFVLLLIIVIFLLFKDKM